MLACASRRVGDVADRDPRRVARERHGAAGALADRELHFLVAARGPDDHLAVALQRRQPVRQPLAVWRERGGAQRAEGRDVGQLQGPGR